MTGSSARRFAAVLVTFAAVTAVALPATAQDSAAQNLLEEARRLESEGNFDEADDSYRVVLERFPATLEAQEASIALARSLMRRGRPEEALVPLEQLVDSNPESPNAASAAVLQAVIRRNAAESKADLDEARTMLSRVPLLYGPERFTSLDARVEARVRSGEIRLLLGPLELASLDFLQAIEDEPASPWLPRARLGLARSLLLQGRWEASAEILQRLIEDGSEPEAAAAATLATFIHRHWLRPSLGLSPWTTARAVSGPIAWKKPQLVSASGDGRLLVFDQGEDLVVVIGPGGDVLNRSQSKNVRDVWWGADGRAYRANADGARAVDGSDSANFNREGADKTLVSKNLTGAQRGLFGHWLTADRGQGAVLAYTDGGAFGKRVASLDEPADLTLSPLDQVLVLDRKAGRVTRLDLDFASVESWSGSWRRPEKLATDASGNVYVLDVGENRIDHYDASGTKRGSVGPGLPGGVELRGAEDLSVDGEGRLWIVDSRLSQLIVLE